jgi:hypothetical protein
MKALHRRTFLRGIGTAIALPFLDAMMPAFAATTAKVAAPCRFMVVYAPTGMIMDQWTPKVEGTGFELPRILKPLEAHREDILVLSGLGDHNGKSLGDGPGDHARAASSYLTGAHPHKTEGADIRCGISVDQVAAQQFGKQTRFASMELTCEDSRQVGACDSYSCAYQSIAWKSETQPLPPEMNPRSAFDRLFGDDRLRGTPAERADRQSVLDLAMGETKRLENGLGAADRRKLDEYLTSIREIEVRIDKAEKERVKLPADVQAPAGIPTNYAEHARLMFDLAVLAFQTDATRVVTFMMAREGGLRSYPEAGVPDAHHSITHHRGDPVLIEKVTKINCYHMEQFAYFLDKLKSTADHSGTLLDHSVVTYGSALGDPNVHDHMHLPTIVAGNAMGRIRTGRHIRYADETPLSNLHLSLLDLAGVRVEKMGDSTGKLDYLTGLS